MNRRQVMAGLAAAPLAGLGGCGTVYRNTFKLTIEVEVDGERKIASSVYEREIHFNLGGVADRIRGTMPHMSLGRHGDMVVMRRGSGVPKGRTRREDPLYVLEKVTWYVPPFDDGQEPAKAVLYPSSKPSVVVPAGGLLSLRLVWRPPGVSDVRQFKSIDFVDLSTAIDPAVRPVRITMEPTREPLRTRIENAPQWIKEWRRQYEELKNSVPSTSGKFNSVHPTIFEAERGS